ncbi:MAG TPA: NAD-dependent epimerase/dehydratase family protein [Candidatus Limnocylindria bacterium]|nr:NAD-dependent epimerase/dehydratase family protein [Candidatus Limnocylindria bacterium]
MRVFATGTTGFLGSVVAEQLRARGDTVVALVRDPAKAELLKKAGRDVIVGDLADPDALKRGCDGCDAVVHAGAIYEVGIGAPRRVDMHEANVNGTERLLSAALAARVPKVVHVSSIVVFGNTKGKVVDETYRRADTYTSYYDETKTLAHRVAEGYSARGLPVTIAQPGQIYGPGDHSGIGALFRRAAAGKLPVLTFGDLGLSFVHVADAAGGIVRLIDRGRPGQAYVLGGEMATLREAVRITTSLAGKPAPRFEVPSSILRFAARLRPDVAEVVRSADGVTFWATDAKARAELGYSPRSLREGLVSYLSSSSSSSSSNSSE